MRILPCLFASLAVAGCDFHLGDSTEGSHGNASFAYGACLFGCSVDQPMMLGTEESISISGASIPAVDVTSTDGSVLAVVDATHSCCDATNTCESIEANVACPKGDTTSGLDVRVRTSAAGSAELVLKNVDGSVFDSVTLTVSRPTSLALTCDNSSAPAALRVGGTCAVGWTAKDAQGRTLMATTGVALSSNDPDVAEMQPLFGDPTPTMDAVQGFLGTTIVARAPGDATVVATATGAASSIAVHVTE